MPLDSIPKEQEEKGSIYVNGFKISGGRLNEKNFYLEDELAREFANSVPAFMVKVKRRQENNRMNVEFSGLYNSLG